MRIKPSFIGKETKVKETRTLPRKNTLKLKHVASAKEEVLGVLGAEEKLRGAEEKLRKADTSKQDADDSHGMFV